MRFSRQIDDHRDEECKRDQDELTGEEDGAVILDFSYGPETAFVILSSQRVTAPPDREGDQHAVDANENAGDLFRKGPQHQSNGYGDDTEALTVGVVRRQIMDVLQGERVCGGAGDLLLQNSFCT